MRRRDGSRVPDLPKGELLDFFPFLPLFERTEMQLVARLLQLNMNVIDAGANIGIYSLLAAKRIGDNGKIWSFEPSQTGSKPSR
jgi:hypothetical protein